MFSKETDKLGTSLGAVIVGGILFGFALCEPKVMATPVLEPHTFDLETNWVPMGRILYAVVDRDGVYLGTARIEHEGAAAAVSALMKRQGITHLEVYGTEAARYGDVIALYSNLDARAVKCREMWVRPLPQGTRLPLTGRLKRDLCCSYRDVENEGHPDLY